MKHASLLVAIACTALIGLALPAEARKSPIQYTQDKGKIVVTISGEPFTEFITADTSKPYLYPIIGPTGASMTRGYPIDQDRPNESRDHPHHRSLWFAHGGVGSDDFWHDKKAGPTIQSNASIKTAKHIAPAHDVVVGIETKDKWISKSGKPLIDGESLIKVGLYADARFIDYSTTLAPAKEAGDITFADTKEGTMAIRLHPALRLKGDVATGKCINSEGDKDGKCWGKRAKWVAYWGQIDGKTCGVAVFDHPTNLRHPTWWHARDYGLVAANPFGISDFEKLKPRGKGEYTLKAGETLSLRYRFVFFAGTAEEADVEGKYDQWVKETTEQE